MDKDYPTKYGQPLSKTKAIRLTETQLDLINSAGSTDQWREWMIEKARKELGITPPKQLSFAGSADQWGQNESTD